MSKSIMNPAEKKAWTSLLRSGDLKQGFGALRKVDQCFDENTGTVEETETRYCCLGVARLAISGREPARDKSMLRANAFGLSSVLQEALAVANDPNHIDYVRETFSLAGFTTIPKRDKRSGSDAYSSFDSIADWIDANL